MTNQVERRRTRPAHVRNETVDPIYDRAERDDVITRVAKFYGLSVEQATAAVEQKIQEYSTPLTPAEVIAGIHLAIDAAIRRDDFEMALLIGRLRRKRE